MNYYPFDSRNSLYKPHFGAVKAGETLLFRLLIHNDAHLHNAYLVMEPDGKSSYEIHLEPKEWLEDYRFYDCEIKLDEGLFWYFFRYTSDYGEFLVTKTQTSLGIVSENGGKWQQTVYAEDFTTPDFLGGGIIYQIFPDRFYNSGKIKKNVPDDRFLCSDWSKQPEHRQNNGICSLGNDYYGGDLQGITEKLPYLKELGVSVIYLNPIFEAHSNHRYNTADYMKIDSLLGTEEDLKSLCKKAKALGISVILDGVFSHTGDDSIYFNKYKRYGDGGAFNDYNSPYRKWYSFGDYDCGYSAWWGVPSLPEVNEENDEYLDFIAGEKGVLKKWLDAGISGYRLDVADELPDKFLFALRKRVKQTNPDAFILGEVWEDASNKISYSKRRKFLLGHQLDSVMNYPFANAILDFVCRGNGISLNETVLNILENYPPQSVKCLMNHIGTHDTVRAITTIAKYGQYVGDRDWQAKEWLSKGEYNFAVLRLKMAAVLQFTLPGIPSIYYGDEAGLSGYGDPFCRGTYPWGNENTDLLDFYKALGTLRRSRKEYTDGQYIPIFADSTVIVYMRIAKTGEKTVIAVNSGEWETPEIFLDFETKTLFGENTAEHQRHIRLKPYGYCIVSEKI